MAIITISRQYGCGGEHVCERIAERLEFRLFHKELVKFAAILTGASEEQVKGFDEEEHSTFRSMMSKYFDTNMFSDLFDHTDYSDYSEKMQNIIDKENETFFDTYSSADPVVDSTTFQDMIKRIINKAAEEMDAVIMGRGGVCILENHPKALHFRLVAKMEDRIRWVSMREELTPKEAEDRIKEIDGRKRKYFKHYFKKGIDDHWMYHGVLNLSKLDMEEAALAIVNIAKTKFEL